MNPSNLKKCKKEEELENLKGLCNNLEDKVSEVMKDILKELEKQEIDGFVQYKRLRKTKVEK